MLLLFNRRSAASAAASLGVVEECLSSFEFDGGSVECDAAGGCSEAEGGGAGTVALA